MINPTFSPVEEPTPALLNSARPASTTSASPSISKPTWVAQLKAAMIFAPLGPNGARLIVNAAVPARGPCSDPSPAMR